MDDLQTAIQTRDAVRQFGGILDLAAAGYSKAPAGRRCPECAQAEVWIWERAEWERHVCFSCGWQQMYKVG
jgi:hypothetical protein